jgi:putative proteasome-type protease
MTYCLGILTREGLVMASDGRSSAGYEVQSCLKMHTFAQPGERVFVILASGGLSLTQSVLTLLERDFARGGGLAAVATMYEAARVVGAAVRDVDALDRVALERDGASFNVHLVLGGQIGEEPPTLYLIYPQGNPLRATPEAPFVQIGEKKYGLPILVRGIRHGETSLEEAAKYALISLDSAARSNVLVGPPVDLLVYRDGELRLDRRRRFEADDPVWAALTAGWDRALRESVEALPAVPLGPVGPQLTAAADSSSTSTSTVIRSVGAPT